jgi:hypothetical protein
MKLETDPTTEPETDETTIEEVAVDETVEDDGVEQEAVEDSAQEIEAEQDDATSELERLRQENALYESLYGDDLATHLGLETEKPAKSEEKTEAAAAPDAEPDLLAPMEFEVTEEEHENILSGDVKALNSVLARRDKVTQHNLRIEQNAMIAQGIMWYLPVANASAKFAERNPELVALPKIGKAVEMTLVQARKDNPSASEAQLVRIVENKLSPMMKRAKSIISEAKKQKDVGQSQPPAARTPAARKSPPGSTRQPRVLSGEEEAQRLIQKMAERGY